VAVCDTRPQCETCVARKFTLSVSGLPRCATPPTHITDMFAVDEATIEAIHRALDEGGELSAIVELRRHFPLITDNAQARLCVRAIASWQPVPASNKALRNPKRH
jgi:hypothetical protein